MLPLCLRVWDHFKECFETVLQIRDLQSLCLCSSSLSVCLIVHGCVPTHLNKRQGGGELKRESEEKERSQL